MRKTTGLNRLLGLLLLGCGMLSASPATAQVAALYGNSIISTSVAPDWYFICNKQTGEVLQLDADRTKLDAATLPLSANDESQLWRFEQQNGQTMLINKGAEGTIGAEGAWSNAGENTTVAFEESDGAWVLKIGDKSLQLDATGATLTDTGTPVIFVKAPVGGGSEWVQLRSYRTKEATYLNDNNGTINYTTTSTPTASAQNFRFVFDAASGSYHLTAKSETGKYVYTTAAHADANMKFSDTETPTDIVMHPLNNRQGYVHLTKKGKPLSRIDFGPTAGFYENFTNAFGTRTNDGFRFVMTTYAEGKHDALSKAIEQATALLTGTEEGADPGQYTAEARQTLSTAIAAATALDQKDDATDEEIAAAVETLAAAQEAYGALANPLRYTTENDTTWYYITSASTSAYATGKVILNTSTSATGPLTFDTKRVSPDALWCIVQDDNGKAALYNMGAKRYMAAQLASGKAGTTDDPTAHYTISTYTSDWFSGTAFTLKSDQSSNPIHAQQSGSVMVTWQVEQSNPSSLWAFRTVSDEELNMNFVLPSTTVQQGRTTTGIGNHDLPLLRATLQAEGIKKNGLLTAVKGTLSGTTDIADIDKVKVYQATNTFELQPGGENAVYLGEASPASDGTWTVTFDEPLSLSVGTSYIWIALDIAETAKEGNLADATITSYVMGDGTETPETAGDPANAATIFLSEGTVVRPGDGGSRYYRIPAITTGSNGRLIAVTDRRWGSEADLPNNIDVIAQYSDDNGKTWSDPQTIAGTAQLGGDYGHGDPAIVTCDNGDIVVLVTSKVGFFYGDGTNIPLVKCIISHDNGQSWDAPIDVTDGIYGPQCTDASTENWLSTFATSGSMIQKRDGTLVVAMPVRLSGGTSGVFLALSDDYGKTWHAAHGNACTDTNESKVIERNNGDLLMSIRHANYNYKNVTTDNGETWEIADRTRYEGISNSGSTGCNGDLKGGTAKADGQKTDRLLQSNCWASTRANVSVVISYDEGETWSAPKSICPGGSAYSALTVLPDGTIGCYLEVSGLEGGYIMRFVRFSIGWLTDGKDKMEDYITTVIDSPAASAERLLINTRIFFIYLWCTEFYTITSAAGTVCPKGTRLPQGVYIVTANGQPAKTIVE